MPVLIKTGVLKYKNPITGEFISLNQVGDDLYSIIAPKYEDIAFPVSRGTLCIYDGGLYRATVDILSSEEWDNTHWVSTSVDDEMSDYATRIIDDSSDGLNKTWSANKISAAFENINSFDVQIVQELPTENIKTHTIYFVPKTGSTNDVYEEYIRINNAWELIGTTEIDLSSKADKADTVLDTTLSRGRAANTTVGTGSFAFGANVEASGAYSHAEGGSNVASGYAAHAEGAGTRATSVGSHAEGSGGAVASGAGSHAEGSGTTASGAMSHTEGSGTRAEGVNSHAEGAGSKAVGAQSHAEGAGTIALQNGTHAEGFGAQAIGQNSHAEGGATIANADYSHVSGSYNVPDSIDWDEWVAGTSYAEGDEVKRTETIENKTVVTGYVCRTANSDSTFDITKWTRDSQMNYAEIVGNGVSNSARSNARALDWNGNERLAGDVYVHCNADSTGGNKVATEMELHITPVFSSGSNLGEYVCNLTFQEVYDAASNGKCDGCIFQVAPGMGIGLELITAFPNAVSFVKTVSTSSGGAITTIALDYSSDGSITQEQTQLDILGLFAKTYAFNTGLFPVKTGDYCIRDSKFYKANTDIAAFEVFNSSKWDEVTVGSELKTITSNSNAMIATIEEDNTSDSAYAVGDIFVYDNKLYKATSAIAVNDYILPNTNCAQTTVSSVLDGKEDKAGLTITFSFEIDTESGRKIFTASNSPSDVIAAIIANKSIVAYIKYEDYIEQKYILTEKRDLTIMHYDATQGAVTFSGVIMLNGVGYDITITGSSTNWWKYTTTEKLTAPSTPGTAGQVLGLDSNLAPVWTAPPSGALIVTASGEPKTLNKTFAEIEQAFDAGKPIFITEVVDLGDQSSYIDLYRYSNSVFEVYKYEEPGWDESEHFVKSIGQNCVTIYSADSESAYPVFSKYYFPHPWTAKIGSSANLIDRNTGILQIPLDSELSSTSENPVQNKIISAALDTKEDKPDLEIKFRHEIDPEIGVSRIVVNNVTWTDFYTVISTGKTVKATFEGFGTVTDITSIYWSSERAFFTGTFLSEEAQFNNRVQNIVIWWTSNGTIDFGLRSSDAIVTDVQVNGTSVLSGGVADIPIANSTTPGVIKEGNGLGVGTDGKLNVMFASDAVIKAGTNASRVAAVSRNHHVTFYGLAKAAGDATQSASSNAVGTYTDEAKQAIQSMLDVPSTEEASNVVIVSDTEPTEEENKLWINNDDVAEYSVPTVAEMNTALSSKVGDVQVNGTSVVSSGVASIPIASTSALGVIRQHPTNIGATGIQIMTSSGNEGVIATSRATDDRIKAGANTNMPIVPSNQHNATFYGLAKAAGDSTQSASSNPVGTYTADALSAIQSMLGIHGVEVVRLI